MDYHERITNIEGALSYLLPEEPDFLTVAKAIKHEMGEIGFQLWNNWMHKSSMYNVRERRLLWDESINADVERIDSLYELARSNGYTPDSTISILHKNEVIVISPEQQKYHVKLDDAQRLTHDEAITSACLNVWMNAETNVDHRYLSNKQAKPYGLAQYGEFLVVPIRVDGLVINLQLIDESGTATYLSDSTIAGGYHSMGKPDSGPILIGTDFASAASAHEATGYFTIAAITDQNLTVVANVIREQHPTNKIIILADSEFDIVDSSDELSKMTIAIAAKIAVPQFNHRNSTLSTFNDLHCQEGLNAVYDQINSAFLAVAVEDGIKASAEEKATMAQLLQDINSIFNSAGTDRLFSRELVTNLVAMKERPWCKWNRGKPLTQNTLARMLKLNKGIHTKKIRVGNMTGRGFYLSQFS